MSNYCTQCGAALPPQARFCSNCGAAVAGFPAAPNRPLLRPRLGRVIAGVCAAMANAYGWDVTAVRIIAIITLVLSSGLIGVAYCAAWIGIPEEALPARGVYPPGV